MKLHYFNLHGRAEPIRMLLAHAKVDFEDVRIERSDWPALKPTMPNGQLPCLELEDGTKMGESMDILNYVATKYGYIPEDAQAAYRSNEVIEAAEECIKVIYLPHFKEGEDKEKMIESNFSTALPNYLKTLESYVSKGEFIAHDKLSAADFVIGGLYCNYFNNKHITFATDKFAKILEDFPNFKAYGERFSAEIESYLASRPNCPI